jgi:hypothetical protein
MVFSIVIGTTHRERKGDLPSADVQAMGHLPRLRCHDVSNSLSYNNEEALEQSPAYSILRSPILEQHTVDILCTVM